MRCWLLLTVFSLIGIVRHCYGQDIQKGKDQVNGSSYHYCFLEPQGAVTGIVVLLPGAGEQIRSVFSKTLLPEILADKGFVVIVPEVHSLLFLDQYTSDELDHLLKVQIAKYQVSNYVLCGFSSGGAIAARYAEYVLAKNNTSALKGIILIDPPLDLERVYASAERMVSNCNGIIRKEGYTNKAQLEQALGGSPSTHHQNYVKFSSYSSSMEDGGNARYLNNLPIRLYSEPDLNFVKRTYCPELQLTDINSSDLEALNQFLVKSGNPHSQYFATSGRGFHSWNIVEPINCAEWIVKICK